MRKLTEKLVGKILPKATGKASPVVAKCYSGCGGDGVWHAAGRQYGGKPPCC